MDGGADVEPPRVNIWRRGTDQVWRVVSGRGRHWWFATGIVLAVTFQVARTSLNDALLKLHPPNERAFPANDLHDGVDSAAQALTTWDRGSIEFEDFLRIDGRAIGKYHTLAEVLLVPVLCLLLYAAMRSLRAQLGRNGEADTTGEGFAVAQYLLRLAIVFALPVYFLLGLLNQGLEYSLLANTPLATETVPADPSEWMANVLEVLSWIRLAALALILVPILIAVVNLVFFVWHPLRAAREQGAAFRVVFFVVVAYAVAMQLGTPAEQGRDAVRFWRNQPWQAGLALLAVGWFAVTVAAIALRLRARPVPPGSKGGALTSAVLWCLGGAALFLTGWIAEEGWGRLGGIQVLGGMLLVVGLLSLPIAIWGTRSGTVPIAEAPHQASGEEMTARSTLIPGLLAFVPLLVFGATIIQATLPEVLARTGAALPLVIAFTALLAAIVIYVGTRSDNSWLAFIAWPGLGFFFRFVTISLVVLLGLMGWVWVQPWGAPPVIGVQALLGAFFALTTIVLGGLGYVVEGWRAPAAFQVLGLRRIPLVTLVVAWAILSAALVTGPAFHAVRIEAADPVAPDARSLSVADAFGRWLDANQPATPPAEGERVAVPLVLVSAAGGGIKAASFTATVTDCLFAGVDRAACRPAARPEAWRALFAMSGASGGSVGFASTVAQREEDDAQDAWVRDRLGTDLLSASMAWQLFVEAGNALVRYDPGLDRAEVLERSWERRWGSDTDERNPARAFTYRAQEAWEDPLLFFSGTDLLTGCRANVSALDGTSPPSEAAPGSEGRDCRRRRIVGGRPAEQQVSVDVLDYLCRDQDLRLSTAAFLSARFPFVSPAGELRPAAARDEACSEARGARTLAIGDGGYRDNTGTGALADVWDVLEPLVIDHNAADGPTCVVPFYVEIDNGYRTRAATSGDGRLRQTLAPLTGAFTVFSARDAAWAEALAADFRRPADGGVTARIDGRPLDDRFVRLSMFAHPGVQAPLGWLLSDAAVDDIQRQLEVEENADAVSEVRSWLEPGALTC